MILTHQIYKYIPHKLAGIYNTHKIIFYPLEGTQRDHGQQRKHALTQLLCCHRSEGDSEGECVLISKFNPKNVTSF